MRLKKYVNGINDHFINQGMILWHVAAYVLIIIVNLGQVYYSLPGKS